MNRYNLAEGKLQSVKKYLVSLLRGSLFYDENKRLIDGVNVPVKVTSEIEMSDEEAREIIAQFRKSPNDSSINPTRVL